MANLVVVFVPDVSNLAIKSLSEQFCTTTSTGTMHNLGKTYRINLYLGYL